MNGDNRSGNADTATPDYDKHNGHPPAGAHKKGPAEGFPVAPADNGTTGTRSGRDCAWSPLEVVVSEMSQLEITEERPLSSALAQSSFRSTLHQLLRAAFTVGGLDFVDATVDEINAELQAKGSQIELGEGAALAHAASGDAETLIITFCRPGTDHPLLLEQIDLRR